MATRRKRSAAAKAAFPAKLGGTAPKRTSRLRTLVVDEVSSGTPRVFTIAIAADASVAPISGWAIRVAEADLRSFLAEMNVLLP